MIDDDDLSCALFYFKHIVVSRLEVEVVFILRNPGLGKLDHLFTKISCRQMVSDCITRFGFFLIDMFSILLKTYTYLTELLLDGDLLKEQVAKL